MKSVWFFLGAAFMVIVMLLVDVFLVKPRMAAAHRREYHKGVAFGIDQTANGYFRLAEYLAGLPPSNHMQACIEVGTGFKNLSLRWENEQRPK